MIGFVNDVVRSAGAQRQAHGTTLDASRCLAEQYRELTTR
jgi:hypothetical protein